VVPTIRPALSSQYAIAGRTLCIEAADELSATVASRFCRDFYLDPISGNSTQLPPYTVRIFSEAMPPALPQGLKTFEVAFGQCHTDGKRSYLTVEGSVIASGIGEAKNCLSVWIGKTVHARHPLSVANLMGYALDLALRRADLYQIHGAGLVTPDRGAGVLILGGSGSGKSTMTALLASRGWFYLTDDALLLSQEGEVIQARGIRRYFAASETTLASCSTKNFDHALRGAILSDPSKRRLEPMLAFPGQFLSSCAPKALFFTSITGRDRSELSGLTRNDTMARLIRSNPWASYDSSTARDHLKLLNRLTNQCRAFSVRAGLDVLSDPSCAEQLLLPVLET
jgi:hypothetical protein